MGRHSTVRPKFMDLMKDGEARRIDEIAHLLDCGEKMIRVIIRGLIVEGKAHVESYRGVHHCAYYRLGAGENAPLPELVTPVRDRSRRWAANRAAVAAAIERSKDEKYRASDTWWPRADPVVVGAMVAMVRAARVSP